MRRTGTTHIVDQEIEVFGVVLTLDIEVCWTSDSGVWRTANGDGEPPSMEIDEIGYDTDEAAAQFYASWFEQHPTERDQRVVNMEHLEIQDAITAAVAAFVEKCEKIGTD